VKQYKQDGFTLVELMIASTVVSVILTVSMVGFMQMSNFFQRAININKTQLMARDTVDEIARTIQGTGGIISASSTDTVSLPMGTTGGTTFHVLCVDSLRYFYRSETMSPTTGFPTDDVSELGGAVDAYSNHVIIRDTLQTKYGCLSDPFDTSTAEVLLDKGFRLAGFTIIPTGTLYTINFNLVYSPNGNDGANSDYKMTVNGTSQYVQCQGGRGRQFCATSNISTTVVRRIGL
jgi:prepilin-type N-terminal cleavage/methylation domain-containing protein